MLSSLPIYYMSLFIICRKVILRLEKIQRDFLKGCGTCKKKSHLVRWSIVCLDRKNGELGIRSLSHVNWAFLGKWNWRFVYEEDFLEVDYRAEV